MTKWGCSETINIGIAIAGIIASVTIPELRCFLGLQAENCQKITNAPSTQPSYSPDNTATSNPTPTPNFSGKELNDEIFNIVEDRIKHTILSKDVDQENWRITWIVNSECLERYPGESCRYFSDYKLNSLKEICKAIFKDKNNSEVDSVVLYEERLYEGGNEYPKRYILEIPQDLKSQWSNISGVKIERSIVKYQ